MPARDEEQCIEAAISHALERLPSLAAEFEVVVVDDGSSDRTGPILERLCGADSRIVAIRLPPSGYAAALRAGLEAARYPVLAYTDCDGQFDLDDLAPMLMAMGKHDLVTGRRSQRRDPRWRVWASRVYNSLARAFLGTGVRDANCALKVFRKDLFDRVGINGSGFVPIAEFIARTRAAGYSVAEVDVRHRPRLGGRTSIRPWVVPRVLFDLTVASRGRRTPAEGDRTGRPR
jgi:dolichol-phosphate mannosyltransferase